MSTLQKSLARQKETHNQLLAILTDDTRRRIIQILHESEGTISHQDLAEQLVAALDLGEEDVNGTPMEVIRVQLSHVHLPKLADNDIIEWDKEKQTVAAADHPVYGNFQPEELAALDDRELIVSELVAGCRRKVLTNVESENEPVAREDVARKLASMEADGQPTDAHIKDVNIQLHHSHLPKLEEAGIIEYDLDDATITIGNKGSVEVLEKIYV